MSRLSLPPVGLGTMGIEDPDTIATALEVGYRHLDTAHIYDNEETVGEGLARSDVPREDVIVATKLWVDSLAPDDVRPGVEASLDRLGLDAVDLCYVHRPRGDYDPAGTLGALDELVDAGLVEHIGVSNFTLGQLEEVHEVLGRPPAAHQAEYHPYFRIPELVDHARTHDYPFVAYSPLAGGRVLDDPVIQQVAAEHDATPAQAALAYVTGTAGLVAIAKSSSLSHLRANLFAPGIQLTDDQRRRIDDLERGEELFPE